MPSKTKRARRMTEWRRYVGRYDRLTEHQPITSGCLAPIHVTPGFFRAEGWSRFALDRTDLRHGA